MLRFISTRLPALLAVAVVAGCSSVQGQAERLELGQRLRRFELAWQEADDAHRAAAAAPMERAVRTFFSLQLQAAGRLLDEALFATRPAPPSAFERSVIPLRTATAPAVSAPGDPSIRLQLEPFYDGGSPPDDARVEFLLAPAGASGTTFGQTASGPSGTASLAEARAGLDWETGPLDEGDWMVRVAVSSAGEKVPLGEVIHSRIANLAGRLEQLEAAGRNRESMPNDSVRATIADLVSLIRSTSTGEVQETVYPAARLLRFAEELAASPDRAAERIVSAARERDVWLTLASGRKKVAIRLRAPAEGNGPWPVLFLLHGAGGSENMFFETYGAGRAVTEGVRRGWLVVAPRQGFTGMPLDCAAMLDALDDFFDIDRSRVVLAGHSMGAAQVMRQVSLHPELPAAAVAMGGGGRMADAARVAGIPWFVAAGERDFGRGGAAALARSLQAAGASVEHHEIQAVEHMVIVQAALPLMFEFLDRVLAAPAASPPR